jgi:hypothetical protein
MMHRETHDEILARARRFDLLEEARIERLMEEARIERLLKNPRAERPRVIIRWWPNVAALFGALRLRLTGVKE